MKEEYYTFLDDLRKSGVTNMFAAALILAKEFGIPAKEAREILKDWIATYSEEPL